MAFGSPFEARWVRPEPRSAFFKDQLRNIMEIAFPGRQVARAQWLTEGLRNANFKVRLDCPAEDFVVRIYEHDPALCCKEIDLFRLFGLSIPVPEVTFAQPGGLHGLPPFVVLRFVEGVTLRELKRRGDARAVADASFATGQNLARIHSILFETAGWIGPGLAVTTPPFLEDTNPCERVVDHCLGSPQLRSRIDSDLRNRFQASIACCARQLTNIYRQSCLVHGDFGKRNILVHRAGRKWTVSAILDWEFAISGPPLIDVGQILRYERVSRPLLEPAFSSGYSEAGGQLPHGWRRLARLLDAISLFESLTRNLPEAVSAELVELIRAAVEDRDPQC